MKREWHFAAVVIGTALATVPQCAFAAAPTTLSPSSPWNVHYADDSCRLAREFGPDGDKVVLLLDQFAPASAFDISLSGKATAKIAKAVGKEKVGFGPDLPLKDEQRLLAGTSGTKQPMIVVGQLDLLNRTGDDADLPIPPADIAKIREFRVQKGSTGVVLQLGPLGSALKAMAACTSDLVKLWGLDPIQQASLASRPDPITPPERWLRSGDYPTKAMNNGDQAVVNFRLVVDADGTPTRCAIQTSTRSPEFTALTCQLIMKRARFAPARDSGGSPVASYYVNSVRWIMVDG